MGVVYRARQLSLDRVVALKVLGGPLTHPAEIARFRRSASAAARLSHPGIAAVHFVGQDAHACYLAMEFVDGQSLQQLVRALAGAESVAALDDLLAADQAPTAVVTQRFDLIDATTDLPTTPTATPPLTDSARRRIADPAHHRRCAELVRDAARALHHAHGQGVVHRDVKPGNLMLDRAGQVKVIDFGVARYFEDTTLTVTGRLVGTPLYMSPEQVTGRLELTAATDVYSLGLVLIELLTLRPPIRAANREELMRRIVTKPLPPLRRANPAAPAALEAVAHTAAARDPDRRYPTAAAFADDLQAWLDGRPVAARPYRATADEAEVLAHRPGGLVGVVVAHYFLGGVLITAGLAGLWVGAALSTPSNRSPVVAGGVIGVCLTAAGVGIVLTGSGIQTARPWSFSASLAAMAFVAALPLLFRAWLYAWSSGADGVLAVVLPGAIIWPVALAAVASMTRRRTRDWFRLAARVRAEAAGPAE